MHAGKAQTLVVTYNETIFSNDEPPLAESDIADCTAEEADPRLIRHAINQAKCGYADITIRTVDSDVFVLSIAYLNFKINHGATQVFVQHTKTNETSEYNIIELSINLDRKKSIALPYFHSFNGCDTFSSFFGKGKLPFWGAWMSYQDDTLTDIFIELGNFPLCVTDGLIDTLEKYVIKVYYGQNSNYADINEARVISFFKPADPNLRSSIMSRSALREHAKRSATQAGWLWRDCVRNVHIPDPRIIGMEDAYEIRAFMGIRRNAR